MPPASERLRFKALLVDSEPPIWRTIDIDARLTLDVVHDVLQVAFGWEDYHLHLFDTARPYSRPKPGQPEPKRYGPVPDGGEDPMHLVDVDPDQLDERTMPIGRLLTEESSPAYYLYDFGDDWMVQLEFVETRRAEPGEPIVRIVRAKLRGPTEDSGGVPGWEEKRGILDDPSDEEHEDIAEWLREVDPQRWPLTDVVDVDALNREVTAVLSERKVDGPAAESR